MDVMADTRIQNKQQEISFFNVYADTDGYDVFSDDAKSRIIDSFIRLTGLVPGSKVADLGCGSGTFTEMLRQKDYDVTGVDLCPKLVTLGQNKYPGLNLIEGDVELLPFETGSYDGVLLSGLVHHFPDPRKCAAETFRILKPGGRFMAFDPNRMNPFMYLYRDPSSPFYSSVGVTENERPVLASEISRIFREAGFTVSTDYLAGLAYRYVASEKTRIVLPIYNFIDRTIFNLGLMKPLRPFVLTSGEKR
jgi:ubiquinone/menaquinone biosynthesis C-methylase UbiE